MVWPLIREAAYLKVNPIVTGSLARTGALKANVRGYGVKS
jgi:hypothetical protein